MTAPLRHIAQPVILWALHFIAVYALISAACGPRGLLEPDILRATVALVTLLAGALTLALLIGSMQRVRRLGPGAAEADLARAAGWAAAISLLAILGNLWPVALLTGCTG